MSACSATVGSSCRSRKHSSVRNSPTPSIGCSTALRAEAPSATLASSLTGAPSLVRPGPAHAARAARCSRAAATRRSASSASGLGLDRARGAVDQEPGAVGDLQGARRADHAGDGELAGDDRGVAGRAALLGDQGVHDLGVQTGRVGRGEVLGDEHHRRGRQRHARLRLAHEVRDDAAFDVAQVGRPLGHQAAHAREDRDELLDGAVHRGDDRSASGERLLDRGTQALVARQTGARGEHLGRGAVGPRGLLGEAVGHGLGRDVVGCQRGVGVGEAAVPEALDGDGVDLAADSERGGVCDTRDHRRALQVRHDRIQLCASLTVNIFGRRTTQTQIKTHIRPSATSSPGGARVRSGAPAGDDPARPRTRADLRGGARAPVRRHHRDRPPRPVGARGPQPRAPRARRRRARRRADVDRGRPPRPRRLAHRAEAAHRLRRARPAAPCRLHRHPRRRQHDRTAEPPAAPQPADDGGHPRRPDRGAAGGLAADRAAPAAGPRPPPHPRGRRRRRPSRRWTRSAPTSRSSAPTA